MAETLVAIIPNREFVIFIDGWPHNAQANHRALLPKKDAANLVKAGYAEYDVVKAGAPENKAVTAAPENKAAAARTRPSASS